MSNSLGMTLEEYRKFKRQLWIDSTIEGNRRKGNKNEKSNPSIHESRAKYHSHR